MPKAEPKTRAQRQQLAMAAAVSSTPSTANNATQARKCLTCSTNEVAVHHHWRHCPNHTSKKDREAAKNDREQHLAAETAANAAAILAARGARGQDEEQQHQPFAGPPVTPPSTQPFAAKPFAPPQPSPEQQQFAPPRLPVPPPSPTQRQQFAPPSFTPAPTQQQQQQAFTALPFAPAPTPRQHVPPPSPKPQQAFAAQSFTPAPKPQQQAFAPPSLTPRQHVPPPSPKPQQAFAAQSFTPAPKPQQQQFAPQQQQFAPQQQQFAPQQQQFAAQSFTPRQPVPFAPPSTQQQQQFVGQSMQMSTTHPGTQFATRPPPPAPQYQLHGATMPFVTPFKTTVHFSPFTPPTSAPPYFAPQVAPMWSAASTDNGNQEQPQPNTGEQDLETWCGIGDQTPDSPGASFTAMDTDGDGDSEVEEGPDTNAKGGRIPNCWKYQVDGTKQPLPGVKRGRARPAKCDLGPPMSKATNQKFAAIAQKAEYMGDRVDCWIICVALPKNGMGEMRLYENEDMVKDAPQVSAEVRKIVFDALQGKRIQRLAEMKKENERGAAKVRAAEEDARKKRKEAQKYKSLLAKERMRAAEKEKEKENKVAEAKKLADKKKRIGKKVGRPRVVVKDV